MKKLLVTGLTGFVGSSLMAWLEGEGRAAQLQPVGPTDELDLRDAAAVAQLVRSHAPDAVLHLAAQSHVGESLADPAATLQVNVVGTANLLKALTDQGFSGRMLYVSSADVYGAVPEDRLPVAETQPPAPRSPYGASKVAAEVLCQQWARTYGLQVVIARPFNHTGPGQRPDFAPPGFARDAVAIARGLRPPQLPVGDLQVTRDFLDVRDVIDAYVRLLEKGVPGEIYNVCSGRELKLADLLADLLALAGADAQIVPDPARMRPAEQRRMCGDNRKLVAATGWQPRHPLQDTLRQLIAYWHKELDT
ncbi:MAG TPA: GDP-mannose 4,6-dehydratase [Ramlibacter sp.]|nr:GDP-mannose 4,6-dehydratase [Ramlibacter sp.]